MNKLEKILGTCVLGLTVGFEGYISPADLRTADEQKRTDEQVALDLSKPKVEASSLYQSGLLCGVDNEPTGMDRQGIFLHGHISRMGETCFLFQTEKREKPYLITRGNMRETAWLIMNMYHREQRPIGILSSDYGNGVVNPDMIVAEKVAFRTR